MGQQVRNFFYFVEYVYKAYKGISKYYDNEGNIITYSDECYKTFDRFIGYIERCEFSNKKSDKFLCKNWRCKKEQLKELWVQEFGTVKKEDTLRSQIATLSRELYSIFGDEWATDFMDDECSDLASRLDMLERQATNFNIVALSDTSSKIVYRAQGDYNIDELTAELNFLHKYNKEQYNQEFKQLDFDKLSYIKDKIDEPLCLNGKYNKVKANILRKIEGNTYEAITMPIEKVASGKQLNVMTEVLDNNADKEDSAARLNELKEFMYKAFTIEGLKGYLSQFSASDIKQAYKELSGLYR